MAYIISPPYHPILKLVLDNLLESFFDKNISKMIEI